MTQDQLDALFTLDMTAKAFIILVVIYGTSIHEMAHAYVATWLGDPTPGRHGRLTLNPIPHLQPVITAVIAPVLIYLSSNSAFGLATTPIDPTRFRNPLRDRALVAVAGPVMNFLLAGLIIGVLWIPGVYTFDGNTGTTTYTTQVLFHAALWEIVIGIFNLLPIPPLDGSEIVRIILPFGLRRQMDALRQMGPMVFLLPLFLGSYIFRYVEGPLLYYYIKLLPH